MKPRVVILPLADRDLDEKAEYIARNRPVTARRFYDAADRAFERLANTPGLGGPWESTNPNLAGLRVWPIPRFKNYLIFYRPIPDGIEVVRVLHGAQDIESILGA